MPESLRVALVTLGCARNEVDSEELAGRLSAAGWTIATDPTQADTVVVNTCGFIDAAKRDSVDALLAAADLGGPRVVAVGCLAERYGNRLAESLPEADAVLGFDDYAEIDARLRAVLAGESLVPHAPRDRRLLLPVTPVERSAAGLSIPGHDHERVRLETGPVAPLKLASGCDRRCSFCAIPSFRGAFVSRRPAEVLADARSLAATGVRELVLVSENSTSYGKDLGDPRLLEGLLPQLASVPGVARVRLSYLQPAELRPGLVGVLAGTPGVAAYFDLSFQHASRTVLRRMRRFGGTQDFLRLVATIRDLAPEAGIRSNVIVGFPGETEDDVDELESFLAQARLDAVGVFGYSAEEGTAAASLPGALDEDEIRRRVERLAGLVEELQAQRAEDRIGTGVEVLVEQSATQDGPAWPVPAEGSWAAGRAAHQGPEDGVTWLRCPAEPAVGDVIPAIVSGTDGVDLVAEPA